MRNWGFVIAEAGPPRELLSNESLRSVPGNVQLFRARQDADFKTLFSRKSAQAAKKHGRFFASGFPERFGAALPHSTIDWEDVVDFFERALVRSRMERLRRAQADKAEAREAL